YEDVLHGDVGYQQVEINAQGRVVRVLEKTPPTPGNDLYLTVDAGLQREAHEALAGRRGAIVAIDPETGGVLAMASAPSFDPNLFVNGIGRSAYAALRDSPDRPLFNRALQGQYPPGSTIKPLVALAGLELGHRHADDATSCPGWYRLPGESHRYRDWLKRGHGKVDMLDAIAQSCDVYFYDLARDLGIDDLHDFMARFGFGTVTGIDVPNEASGLFPSSEWKRRARGVAWYPGETLIAGIGQGFTLATPLQLASAMATLAQRGFTLTPHLLGQVENPLTHMATEPQVLPRQAVPGVSDAHWDIVIGGMREVLFGPRGTARGSARGAKYEYAGKTGTAQLFRIAQDETVKNEDVEERLRDHALFVAFAPLQLPRIAVGIIVENGSSGSRTAAPIARRLFDYYLVPEASEDALAADDTH
ncbi:MAG: penicillin-binding protein 2, partial [Gammaproteobacteria bacterium]|nr:penicillin-binding protein 2 [Gammaproteobacteria bacterium]